LRQQLAKALAPRPAEPLPPPDVARIVATIQAHPEPFRTVLMDLLAEPIGRLVALLARPPQPPEGPNG
jgi:hypothetical protein